jgi:hypothetical protein
LQSDENKRERFPLPPSGCRRSDGDRREILLLPPCAYCRSYETIDGDWKIIIDTDTDKPSYAYNEIAFGISDYCIVPLHADVTDFYRVRNMMVYMCDLMKKGACKARVQQVRLFILFPCLSPRVAELTVQFFRKLKRSFSLR